jgi:hypothetical protein
MAALDLRHPGANRVAWKSTADEDDEAIEPGDAVAPVGERVDVELELLVLGDGGGHRVRLAAVVEPRVRRSACGA